MPTGLLIFVLSGISYGRGLPILAEFAPVPNAHPAVIDENAKDTQPAPAAEPRPGESGGPSGPEPTRYGDWERNGRCIDF
jgi:hypothetical protein